MLVGYGRVGRHVAATLRERGVPFVAVEHNRDIVQKLRSEGVPAVLGDAAEPAVLVQAHIAEARMLVVAIPDPVDVRAMIDTARALSPAIAIAVRTHSEDEAALLEKDGCGRIFFGERELAGAMTRYVLETLE